MLVMFFLALVSLGALLIVPALALQAALAYWYRPAERSSLEEAWNVRLDDRLRAPVLRG
jgi:hypothetical protein